MRILCFILYLFVVFEVSGGMVCADEVFLKNGQRFKGQVIEETEEVLVMRVGEDTITFNKATVLHLEHGELAKEDLPSKKKEFHLGQFFRNLKKDNWHAVRRYFYKIHNRIFSVLEKNALYQRIANKKAIKDFRMKGRRNYFFGVYMVLLLIVSFILKIIKDTIMGILRKIYGVERRYDI